MTATTHSAEAAGIRQDQPVLDVHGLTVTFRTEVGSVSAVDHVDLRVAPGEIVGIVGESGSGKSMTAMAVMRLIRDPNAVIGGQVLYRGTDLFALSRGDMRDVRGSEIAMVFQDPMTSAATCSPGSCSGSARRCTSASSRSRSHWWSAYRWG